MTGKTIEARLVISGEDRASQIVEKVTKATRQFARDADMSATMKKNAEAAAKAEAAFNAVTKAMAGRDGFAKAQADAKAAEAGLAHYVKQLDAARQAKAAFNGVKPAKGSEEAAAYTAAAKALREATSAHQRAEREVVKTTAAMRAEERAMREAERAATTLGADLGNLEAHQRRLKTAFEATTAAMAKEVQMQDRAAAAAKRHAAEQAEHARHMRRHGLVGAAATAASGYVGVHGVIHTGERAAHAGAEVQREKVRLEAAGVPAAERQHIADESLKLAVEAKNVTQAAAMELWKEMRSVMTDPHEVDHVIGSMVKAKSILDAGDSSGTASHGLNLLVKGAENIGAAKDPVRFTKLLDGYVKAMQVMGKTITPEGIYEAQKYSKSAGARWSDRFIMTTMQSLGQEMGGSTAGNSIQMAQKQIVGGMQNLHSKAKEFARIGLIDPKNLDYLKTGEVKGTKAGVKHAVKGDDLAATDLDKWVYKILLPHLEKAGIRAEGDQLAWVQKNFTGTGGDIISKLIMQRESFEAHARMYENAAGLKGQALNRDDALAGLGAVQKSLETFAGVLTAPVMQDAAHALDAIAGRIGSFSTSLEAFNKAHPEIAKYEGGAALGAGLAGAGAASAAVWKLMSGGFGLKGSAAALDGSAAALTAAAVKLGATGGLPGSPGVGPDGGKPKGGKLKAAARFGASLVGAVALEPLAEEAQRRHMLEMPNLDDGLGRAALNFLDPRLGNIVLGDRAKAIPSMAFRPGQVPLTLGGSGLNSFGLTGPMSPEELAKRDADRYTRALVEARRSAAPLNPGDELPGLGPEMATKAEQRGTEAGQKAGTGIKQGLSDKAPEVEQQGQSIFQRLQQLFSAGIFVPIHFQPGEGFGGGGGGGGSGGIVNASFNPSGGSPFGGRGGGIAAIPGRNAFGGVDPLGSGGGTRVSFGDGSSGGISARDMRDVNPEMAAYIRQSALAHGIDPDVALRIANSEGLRGSIPGVRNTPGDKGTSFGPFQLHYASRIPGLRNGGLGDRYTRETGHHASDPAHWREQVDFAMRTARREGWGAWHGRYGARIGVWQGIGTVKPVPMPAGKAAAAEGGDFFPNGAPRVLKPNSMPDAPGLTRDQADRMRPIPSVPDAPPTGSVGRGGGDLHGVADRMHAAAERFENASMHARLEVVGLGDAGLRMKGVRATGSGALSADMGVSMPGAKEGGFA